MELFNRYCRHGVTVSLDTEVVKKGLEPYAVRIGMMT
jgi:hypothetical protein